MIGRDTVFIALLLSLSVRRMKIGKAVYKRHLCYPVSPCPGNGLYEAHQISALAKEGCNAHAAHSGKDTFARLSCS